MPLLLALKLHVDHFLIWLAITSPELSRALSTMQRNMAILIVSIVWLRSLVVGSLAQLKMIAQMRMHPPPRLSTCTFLTLQSITGKAQAALQHRLLELLVVLSFSIRY